MQVKPDYGYDTYVGHNKLKDKVLARVFTVCMCNFDLGAFSQTLPAHSLSLACHRSAALF